MEKIIYSFIFTIFVVSCSSSADKQDKGVISDPSRWSEYYNMISAEEIPGNPIDMIGNGWMLITSGEQDDYNTMTASWGALGEIWGKPVAIIAVRNIRYTNEFLEKNEHFTLSFFDDDYRSALQLLGTKSGRDSDKVSESGLTPINTPSGNMTFGESKMVLECRKIYAAPLAGEYMMPEIAEKYAASPDEFHIIYIGEIVNAWQK